MKPKCFNFNDVFEPRDASKNVTPWLSGRLGGAAPLEIRPLSLVRLKRGPWSEANCGLRLVPNVNPQRLPQVNSPKSPPTGSHPPTADHLKIRRPLPFGLVKTEEMRSGTSKSLGLAEVGRLKTQPNRRISRFLRPKPRILRDEMAS